MDWALVVILHVMFLPTIAAVSLTVEAEQISYQADFGKDITMGCKFRPKLSDPRANLEVTWHRMTVGGDQEVYRVNNGNEDLASQDPSYRGRASLLRDELKEGWARLQLSGLRINDSGNYQCLVRTAEGVDYTMITLSIKAPYKLVNKSIAKAADGDEVLLTCQSDGYPDSPVRWQDGNLQTVTANTTSAPTPDRLFRVTSEIRVRSSDKNNYTCTFENDGHSATFHLPDEMHDSAPNGKSDPTIILLSIALMVLFVAVAVVMYRRRKGFNNNSTRNLLVDNQDRPVPAAAAACLQRDKENEEKKIIFNEGSTEEHLGEVLKAHYSDVFLSGGKRQHRDAFGVEELPHRLQNNNGQPANLQALLPEAGETLFLEGPPCSGKTSAAHVLVSCWAEGPTHALSGLLDLSALQLLVYVDCSEAKGDLFQEITAQLPLTDKMWTEEELRTALDGSGEALLLLDGYREGNQLLDESLRRFLHERGGCRVLVTACPGHWPSLRDTVGTGRVLQLQTQIVKY